MLPAQGYSFHSAQTRDTPRMTPAAPESGLDMTIDLEKLAIADSLDHLGNRSVARGL